MKDDFDFLHGSWLVQHHKLKTRLAGAADWVRFDGVSETRPIMAGIGNVEDNLLNDPSGAYRAAALRAYAVDEKLWRIWWLDSRFPEEIGPPVKGAFQGDIGIFITPDTWQGKKILLRFTWTKDDQNGPKWEQACSADAGSSWETNWIMRFRRA